MQNINCLTECLKCHTDQGNHKFKLRNTKKWLTLTKNNPKNNTSDLMSVQRSSYQPFIKLIQVPCTKSDHVSKINQNRKSVQLNDRRSSRKSTSPNHHHDQVQLTKDSAIEVLFRPAYNQSRVRSYSLTENQKNVALSHPVQFIYSQQNRQRSISEEKQIKLTNRPQKADKNRQNLQQPYSISPIKQEAQQRQRKSSLFQGAKSIVSRQLTSIKKKNAGIAPFNPKTAQKATKIDVQTFYDKVRLCETENDITYTNQSIIIEGEDIKSQHVSILDQIPMSPHTKQYNTYKKFKIGRLLGVGKWAHVYLCQDKLTNSIYAIKQIFKQSMQAKSIEIFGKSIDRLINLNHSKLINIYSKFQTKDKLCLLVQYCGRSLYEQLKQKGLFSLEKLKKYSRDLIQALVFLHQNEIPHGNLNIFQIFTNFNECKLKPSYPYCKQETNNHQNLLKSDIQGLAIVIFEMGHGLVPSLLPISTLYQKEKLYQDPEARKSIISFINSRISLPEKDPVYILLNDLIKTLLSWNQNWRLMTSRCINHKFFSLNEKC